MSILNVNKINPVGGGSTITIAGIASVTNNISVGNSVTATTYFGDGSQLTGISVDSTKIETGNTKVETIDTGSDGHVKVTTEGTERLRITSDGDVAITTRGSVEGVSKLNVEIPSRTTAFSASDGDTWHDVLIENPGAATTNAVGLCFQVTGDTYHKNAGTGIAAVKNGTNSDYGADLVFITRPQSAVASEKLRISSDGYVTNPTRPAFSTNAQTSGFSSNSTNFLTPSARINNGNYYNASNGRFTAPVDGTYFFFFSYVGDNGVAAPVMYFYVNGSASGPGSSCYYTAYQGAYHGQLYTLTKNDYVNAAARDWNGATPDPWNTYWGGWLLY